MRFGSLALMARLSKRDAAEVSEVRCSLTTTILVVLVVASVGVGVGCKTTDPAPRSPSASSPAPKPPAAAVGNPPLASAGAEAPARPDTSPIRFGFNVHDLDDDAQRRLRAVADYMQRSPETKLRITGHADERGTSEYNLSLGEARARAARDYLVRLGVDAKRIYVQTRGEEDPVDRNGTEAAWAANRRGELLLDGA
jgi:peptidoglycan-associated lipoprotein